MKVRRIKPQMDASAGTRRDEDQSRACRHVEDPRTEDAGGGLQIRIRSRIFMNHPG